jgi:tRNA 2-selenouridine synthase
MLEQINATSFIEDFEKFDLIIDARSPSEFAHSHIPGAKNFYALTNEQHKEVGTLYKNSSKNRAKILGASYICENAAKHIRTLGNDYKIGAKIAIYCARGGMRSHSLGVIFSNIGYRIYKIENGYKGFRNHVVHSLDLPQNGHFVILGGNTGCGKSELIRSLENSIDLERLANHLGSTFGAVNGKQPSQKMFQNELFFALRKTDKNLPIFIESESKRIGSITLPESLYEAMSKGVRIEITAPIIQRIQRILKDYIQIDKSFFYTAIEKITPYIKRSAKEEAIKAFKENDLAKVAQILLLDYYDKVYKKPSRVDYKIENSNHQETLKILLNTTYFSQDLLKNPIWQTD